MRRLDIFSIKGGAGKTTLAYLIARQIAWRGSGSVLLVDADFTGCCVGDLLLPRYSWTTKLNLAHLVCGNPELLPDLLSDEHLPVYVLGSGDRIEKTGDPELLVCPSHGFSSDLRLRLSSGNQLPVPGVDADVLHVLVGHEAAGGWIGHVVEEAIGATNRFLEPAGLVAVIVDHGPGFGPVQSQALTRLDDTHLKEDHRVVVVTTPDSVDLHSVDQFLSSRSKPLEDVMVVVNRCGDELLDERQRPTYIDTWPPQLKSRASRLREATVGSEMALLPNLPKLSELYQKGELYKYKDVVTVVEGLRKELCP